MYRAATDERSRFVGSSDHAVSEAFYFTDPEGNGVELYTDRPRESWEFRRGQIFMTTAYLDPNAYLKDHLRQDVLDAGPSQAGRVGHVHLAGGAISPWPARFYADTLGFDRTMTEYRGSPVRLGRRLPPPPRHEHVEQRWRPVPARPVSDSARWPSPSPDAPTSTRWPPG